VSAQDCVALDSYGYALTYHSGTWSTPVSLNQATDVDVWSLTCPSASFCALVNHYGQVQFYNGSTWTQPETPSPGPAQSISCTSSTFCMMSTGGSVSEYDGASWSQPATVDPNATTNTNNDLVLTCATSTFCVAGDSQGNLLNYDGQGWTSTYHVDGQNGFVDLDCVAANYCFALDGAGNVLIGT